jgi:hypothetical protein
MENIEAHVFTSFLAYCLYVTLGRQLKGLAPGLTARSALEKFAAVQMVDVRIPTTDGRELLLTRHTQTGAGAEAPLGTSASRTSRSAAAKNQRRPDFRRARRVVQTFGGVPQSHQ